MKGKDQVKSILFADLKKFLIAKVNDANKKAQELSLEAVLRHGESHPECGSVCTCIGRAKSAVIRYHSYYDLSKEIMEFVLSRGASKKEG